MNEYKLNVKKTGNKAGQFTYTVTDQHGNPLYTRKSNRKYVACTINGQYFFGRLDLIGKGEHGKNVKRGYDVPIAYRVEDMVMIDTGKQPPQSATLLELIKDSNIHEENALSDWQCETLAGEIAAWLRSKAESVEGLYDMDKDEDDQIEAIPLKSIGLT